MEATPAFSFITTNEFSSLQTNPVELARRADIRIGQLVSEVENSKAELKCAQIGHEQVLIQAEEKFLKCTRELDELKAALVRTKEESSSQAQSRDQTLREIDQMRAQLSDKATAAAQLSAENQTLHADKARLIVERDEKRGEIERLNKEYQAMFEKYGGLAKEKTEIQARLNDVQASIAPIEFAKKLAEQEVERLRQQLEQSTKDLSTKSEDVVNLRKELATARLELQGRVDVLTRENSSLKESNLSLQQKILQQDQEIREYVDKVKNTKEQSITTQESLEKELREQQKLCALIQEKYDESSTKVLSLTTDVENLRRALAESDGRSREETDRLNAEIEDLQTALSESRNEAVRLRGQIFEYERVVSANGGAAAVQGGASGAEEMMENGVADLARSLLSTDPSSTPGKKPQLSTIATPITPAAVLASTSTPLGQLTPSAVAAQMVKQGVSITQVCVQYAEATRDLQIEKRERARAEEYLNSILAELEQKAPVIQAQREEYERMTLSHRQLTERIATVTAECDKLRSETVSLRQENAVLSRTAKDYSAQVQSLLEECQRYKRQARASAMGSGGDVSSSPAPPAVGDYTTGDPLLNEDLVTFRDISELQQKNRKLIETLRTLQTQVDDLKSEKAQEPVRVKSAVDEAVQERVRMFVQELEQIKADREAQQAKIKDIIMERNMYKDIAERRQTSPATPSHSQSQQQTANQPSAAGSNSSPKAPGSVSLPLGQDGGAISEAEHERALEDLRNEFKEHRKRLMEQTEGEQTAKEKHRLEALRATAASEAAEDKARRLMADVQRLSDEISKSKETIRAHEASLLQHQKHVASMSVDLAARDDKAARLSYENALLKAQHEALQEREKRLLEEKKALSEDYTRVKEMVDSLRSLHGAAEATETETRRRLASELESLRSEWLHSKMESELARARSKDAEAQKEAAEREFRAALEAKDKVLEDTRSQRMEAVAAGEALRARLTALEEQLRLSDDKLSKMIEAQRQQAESTSAMRERELQTRAATLQADLTRALDDLKQERQVVSSTKELLQSHEHALEEAQKAYALLKKEADDRETELSAKVAELTAQVASLTTTVQEKEATIIELEKTCTELRATAESERARAEAKVQEAQAKFDEAAARITRANEDVESYLRMHERAVQNYETEVHGHSEALKALTITREERDSLATQLAEAKLRADSAEAALRAAEASWTTQRDAFVKDIKTLEDRAKQLATDNDFLLKTLQPTLADANRRASAGFAELTSPSKPAGAAGASGEEQPAVTPSVVNALQTDISNLGEVVRYLRREKEIAESRHEATSQEATRLRQQLETASRALDESKAQIKALSESLETSRSATSQEFALREQVNLLRESNVTLRRTSEENATAAAELKTRVVALQSELQPLKDNVALLEKEKESLLAERQVQQAAIQMWETRSQQLLQKYGQIDPDEFRKVTAEHDALKAEHNKLLSHCSSVESSLSVATTDLTTTRQEASKLTAELTKSREECAHLKTELGKTREEASALRQDAARLSIENRTVREETRKLRDELASAMEQMVNKETETEMKIKALTEQHNTAKQKLEEQVAQTKSRAAENVTKARTLVEKNIKERQELSARVAALDAELATTQTALAEARRATETVERELRETQERLKKALENAAASAAAVSAQASVQVPTPAQQTTMSEVSMTPAETVVPPTPASPALTPAEPPVASTITTAAAVVTAQEPSTEVPQQQPATGGKKRPAAELEEQVVIETAEDQTTTATTTVTEIPAVGGDQQQSAMAVTGDTETVGSGQLVEREVSPVHKKARLEVEPEPEKERPVTPPVAIETPVEPQPTTEAPAIPTIPIELELPAPTTTAPSTSTDQLPETETEKPEVEKQPTAQQEEMSVEKQSTVSGGGGSDESMGVETGIEVPPQEEEITSSTATSTVPQEPVSEIATMETSAPTPTTTQAPIIEELTSEKEVSEETTATTEQTEPAVPAPSQPLNIFKSNLNPALISSEARALFSTGFTFSTHEEGKQSQVPAAAAPTPAAPATTTTTTPAASEGGKTAVLGGVKRIGPPTGTYRPPGAVQASASGAGRGRRLRRDFGAKTAGDAQAPSATPLTADEDMKRLSRATRFGGTLPTPIRQASPPHTVASPPQSQLTSQDAEGGSQSPARALAPHVDPPVSATNDDLEGVGEGDGTQINEEASGNNDISELDSFEM